MPERRTVHASGRGLILSKTVVFRPAIIFLYNPNSPLRRSV
jgi:hypothetical protein